MQTPGGTGESVAQRGARRGLAVAGLVVVAVASILGLLLFSLIVWSETFDSLDMQCMADSPSGAGGWSTDPQLFPPALVCNYDTGAVTTPLPGWVWIGVAIALAPWVVAAVVLMLVARRRDRLTRATRAAGAIAAGIAVTAAIGLPLLLLINRLYTSGGEDFTSVSFAWWPAPAMWLVIAAGAFVAALRTPGRGVLAGVATGWLAWMLMEFSGAAYPYEPVDPFAAVLSALVGAGVGAMVKRRRRRAAAPTDAQPSEPSPVAQ